MRFPIHTISILIVADDTSIIYISIGLRFEVNLYTVNTVHNIVLQTLHEDLYMKMMAGFKY
ncbi:MAG: hypothetical protein QXP05_01965 [Ignisphaera sp.]|uniref:Uncharacterized protein n=1 Tax=Ignisphaera aggregans TaxID=334771 RepID=A0A7J3MWJ6_9CREN